VISRSSVVKFHKLIYPYLYLFTRWERRERRCRPTHCKVGLYRNCPIHSADGATTFDAAFGKLLWRLVGILVHFQNIEVKFEVLASKSWVSVNITAVAVEIGFQSQCPSHTHGKPVEIPTKSPSHRTGSGRPSRPPSRNLKLLM